MNKLDVFKKEINYIKNERFRESLKKLILELPDYFFEIPSSSTGKRHPKIALGKGGLLRHTKAAVMVAKTLLYDNQTIGEDFINDEKDLILIALILHDGFKSGLINKNHTVFEHPLIMTNFIMDKKNELDFTDQELELLISMIESHMGEWQTSPYSKFVLPKPVSKYQKFVHMCDFLVSRKYIDIDVNYEEKF